MKNKDLALELNEYKRKLDDSFKPKTNANFMMSKDIIELKAKIDNEIYARSKDEVKSTEKMIKLEIENKKLKGDY